VAAAAAVFAAVVGQLAVVAVSAAAVKAAAVTATSSPGQPKGLGWRLRLSTQAACLRLSWACLRAFARRFHGAHRLLIGEGWQEKSTARLKSYPAPATRGDTRQVLLQQDCSGWIQGGSSCCDS
jgi:hypothetical protein